MRFVVYVAVGNLPMSKAEEYVKGVKENIDSLGFFKPEEKVVYLAIRGDSAQTRIEAISY